MSNFDDRQHRTAENVPARSTHVSEDHAMLGHLANQLPQGVLQRKLQRRRAQHDAKAPAQEVSLESERLDLVVLIGRVRNRFDEAIQRYQKLDAAMLRAPAERQDIDFEGKEKPTDPAAIKKRDDSQRDARVDGAAGLARDLAIKGAEKFGEAAGLVPGLNIPLKIVTAAQNVVNAVFAAKHSKAHGAAEEWVLEAAKHDMYAWHDRMLSAASAAGSVVELRAIGTGVLAMLESVRNELDVVQQIQAYVLRLETEDPSFTATDVMDTYRSERDGLGAAVENGK